MILLATNLFVIIIFFNKKKLRNHKPKIKFKFDSWKNYDSIRFCSWTIEAINNDTL